MIIAILATFAIVFFSSRVNDSKDKVADANLRAATLAVKTAYTEAGSSYLRGPLALEAPTDQETASNFVTGAIRKYTSLEPLLTETPAEGKIGVVMNEGGQSGTLYVARSSGYASALLEE